MAKRTLVAVLALLLASLPVRSRTLKASDGIARSQISQLLLDTKNAVSGIKSDIATLDFFVLSPGGPQTKAVMLNLYTEHIATLRDQALKLEAARQSGSHWQQIAVERIVPLMKELASSADAAIGASRTSLKGLNSAELRQYLKLSSVLAGNCPQ